MFKPDEPGWAFTCMPKSVFGDLVDLARSIRSICNLLGIADQVNKILNDHYESIINSNPLTMVIQPSSCPDQTRKAFGSTGEKE